MMWRTNVASGGAKALTNVITKSSTHGGSSSNKKEREEKHKHFVNELIMKQSGP